MFKTNNRQKIVLSAILPVLILGGIIFTVKFIKADTSTTSSSTSNSTDTAVIVTPPTVQLFDATNLGYDSATLNGQVAANGDTTTVWFEYGKHQSRLQQQTDNQTIPGDVATAVFSNISGLDFQTTYYYRIAAQNSQGTVYSNVNSFTTLPRFPSLTFTTSGIDQGASYEFLPLNFSGDLTADVCSNSAVDVNVDVYLDGTKIYTSPATLINTNPNVAHGFYNHDVSFGITIDKNLLNTYGISLNPAEHVIEAKIRFTPMNYGFNAYSAVVGDKIINFYTVAPQVNIKANNSDGPITVELPDNYALSWTSQGAGHVGQSNGFWGFESTTTGVLNAFGSWQGEEPLNGSSTEISVRGTQVDPPIYTYGLTANNDFGIFSDNVKVKIVQVPRCSFSADPTSIVPPEASQLNWSCQYADACSIYNSQNNQAVPLAINNNTSYFDFGSVQIRPSQTTNYTLKCYGKDGAMDSWLSAKVIVNGNPNIHEVNP